MKRERVTKRPLFHAILVVLDDLPTEVAPPVSPRSRTAPVPQRRAPAPPAVRGRAVPPPIEVAVVVVCGSAVCERRAVARGQRDIEVLSLSTDALFRRPGRGSRR